MTPYLKIEGLSRTRGKVETLGRGSPTLSEDNGFCPYELNPSRIHKIRMTGMKDL